MSGRNPWPPPMKSYGTSGGVELTEEKVREMAEEAERGYDEKQLRVRKPEETQTVSDVLRRFAASKQDLDHLKEVVKDEQSAVVGVYRQDGRQTHITDFDEETRVKGTLVEGSRVVIDEDRLKKALGYEKWMKVTSPQLDKDKLEDAVAQGLVDPHIVAECSEEKLNAPYIRLTWKKK